jgi:hypothetical protein
LGQQARPLPPGETPAYELTAPFFAPDDVWYPEGAQFEDVTGFLIPNETMVPLNAAAERRVLAWRESLPSKDRRPPLELVVQAATELRPREGDPELSHKDFQKAVMIRAVELHYSNLGISPDDARARMPAIPTRPDPNVPLMSNTRINGQMGRAAHQPATRLRQAPVAPADRDAPPMGTSQSTNLGRGAHQGVAAR